MKVLSIALPFAVMISVHGAGLDYRREIQPILAEHCFHCHGQDEGARKGNLRLDLSEAALKGGKSDGPAITPNKPEASAVMTQVSQDSDEVMPPPKEKKPLQSADIEKLRAWIKEGARYTTHWAFETPAKPRPSGGSGSGTPGGCLYQGAPGKRRPRNVATSRAGNDLPTFLYLDLIGLPPSPADLDAFARQVESKGLRWQSKMRPTH